MIKFMIYFLPGFLSVELEKDNNKKLESFIMKYVRYTLEINIITLFVLMFQKKGEIFYLTDDAFTLDFITKLLIMNTTVALILPFLNKLIIENIKVEIKKHEK